MHTEHLANLRPSWIAFGWFIAIAVASLVVLALAALGVVEPDAAEEGAWVALAMAIGFMAGGMLAGMRAGAAPILHGVGIGLFSLVVWFLANLLLGEPTDATAWRVLDPGMAAGLLLLQIGTATLGAWYGARRSPARVVPAAE
jgi:hypothetical protein